MRRFNFFIHVFLAIFLFLPSNAYPQTLKKAEIIDRCDEMIRSIYNDIWLIKDGYRELSDLGEQNICDTPDLPPDFRSIKSIRIANEEGRAGRSMSIFNDAMFDKNVEGELYICFSDGKRVLGIGSDPKIGIYIKPLGFYLLFFTASDDESFKHAVTEILMRNARAFGT